MRQATLRKIQIQNGYLRADLIPKLGQLELNVNFHQEAIGITTFA